ncbi:hypothetical protein BDFB_004665, partial [Asbolus verrucosus]
ERGAREAARPFPAASTQDPVLSLGIDPRAQLALGRCPRRAPPQTRTLFPAGISPA